MKSSHKKNIPYRDIDQFNTFDLEMVHLILSGGSVMNWTMLNLTGNDAETLCAAHYLDLNCPKDTALIERIRDESIAYLNETFKFPIPSPVRKASLVELLNMAANTKIRHRQFCACILLKAMHMVNHFDASEAQQSIKLTSQEIFLASEELIYKTISKMMADSLPVVEFMGGRKQRSSMVTKLLSKSNPLSAQLFDKMRFRIVTATQDDVVPTINFLSKNIFPFNYSLAGESYNTLLPFDSYCKKNKHLCTLTSNFQTKVEKEDRFLPINNVHSSPKYHAVHWVADMPIKINDFENAYTTDGVNPVPRPTIYARAEIQILDRKTHRRNERGHASHSQYKARQLEAVSDKLKVRLVNNINIKIKQE